MNQRITDQMIFEAGHSSRASYMRAQKLEQRNQKLIAQREANTVDTSRNPNRFNPTDDTGTRQVYKQFAEPKPLPVPTPPVAVAPSAPKIDEVAAGVAWRKYFTADNGTDRGNAFVEYGICIGEVPPTACGVRDQAQADKIAASINSPYADARHNDGTIQRVQQLHVV
jgi:hypothetical protein